MKKTLNGKGNKFRKRLSVKSRDWMWSIRLLVFFSLCISCKIVRSWHISYLSTKSLEEETDHRSIDHKEEYYYYDYDNETDGSPLWSIRRDLKRHRRRRRRRQPKPQSNNAKSSKTAKPNKHQNVDLQAKNSKAKSLKSTKSSKQISTNMPSSYSFDSSYILRMTLDGDSPSQADAWMIANELQVVTETQVRDQVLTNNPTVSPTSITVVTNVAPIFSTMVRRQLRILQVESSLEFRVETSVTLVMTTSEFIDSGSAVETKVQESVKTALATPQASQIILQKLKESESLNEESNMLIENIKDIEGRIYAPTSSPTLMPTLVPSMTPSMDPTVKNQLLTPCETAATMLYNNCSSVEFCTLRSLFLATGGCNEWFNTSGWDPTDINHSEGKEDYCQWFGVTCATNNNSRSVISLDLAENFLIGEIPTEIGQLKDLINLDLGVNQLYGEIPTEIGQLQNLTFFILEMNQINGTIPTEIGQLQNLERLYLFANKLNGSIPTEIGQLQNLERLFLVTNELNGSIPTEIGQLQKLENLEINDNKLKGRIPTEIGQLQNLQSLNLKENQLTGSIPSEVGQLLDLERLFLGSNILTGAIPVELCSLYKNIDVSDYNEINLTSCEIQDGVLPCLNNLTASLRCFDSPLSTECALLYFFNATNGCYWTMNAGWTEGKPFCSWFGVICIPYPFDIIVLQLSNNNLRGSIPTNIGLVSNLAEIHVFDNDLTGTIPTEIGNLSMLQSIVAYSNSMSGTLPNEMKGLTDLSSLLLDDNMFTGTLFTEIGQLINLKSLWLSNNMFEGTISSTIGNMKNLKALELDNNKFTGKLPSELGNLDNLEDLELQNNFFTGTIPEELCSMREDLRTFNFDTAELEDCPSFIVEDDLPS